MYRTLLLLLLSACGLTRIEHVGDDDAAADAAMPEDSMPAIDAIDDSQTADAPLSDIELTDAIAPPDVLTGNCVPSVSECPNQAHRIELGVPRLFKGALVQGLANDVASTCGGGDSSDWTFAVTAAAAGLLELRFASAVSYGIEIRDGSCEGPVQTCSRTNSTQTAVGIDAEQTFVIVLEAITACDVPFDLTVTLLPR